jgi:hypothetical protein
MKLVNNIIQGLIVTFGFMYLFFIDDIYYYNFVVYIMMPIFFGLNFGFEYILKSKGENLKTLKYMNIYSLISFIYFGKNFYNVNLFGILLFSNIYVMYSRPKKQEEEKVLIES